MQRIVLLLLIKSYLQAMFYFAGQPSDSGKFMVKATNAGGEAKSIADCAILEPSPERMQEVVKTIVYDKPPPAEYKTEVSLNVCRF